MVKLELIEFADFLHPPEFVSEIFRQNPDMGLPVPLGAIAYAAGGRDLDELKELPIDELADDLIVDFD